MAEVVMRVAILSDTHGYLDPRIAAEVANCDYAVHAGDIGARSVLAALQPRRGKVLAVRGNNDIRDKWPLHELHLLDILPLEAMLNLPGGHLVVVHGDRAGTSQVRHERLRMAYPKAKIVVYGHSHHLCCDASALPWVLNPGAAGRSRTYGGPSCLILDASVADWQIQVRRFAPLPKMPLRESTRDCVVKDLRS